MASSTRNPTASASIVTGWSNVSYVYGSDNQRATATETTAVMAATGFGFAIPTGSTIVGIEIVTEYQGAGNNGVRRELTLQLTKNGSAGVGTATAVQATLANTDQTFTVGGSTNLLGNTLSVAEVNASTFGVLLQPSGTTNYSRAVDHVYLVVYYDPPAFSINAEATSQSITGAAGSVIKISNIVGGSGTTALTGTDPTLARDSNISAGVESYAIAGTDVTFIYDEAEGGTQYSLTLDPGEISQTGADVVFALGLCLQALTWGPVYITDADGFEITDADGELIIDNDSSGVDISYAIDGTDASFHVTATLLPGSTAITGADASLSEQADAFNAEAGAISITGASATVAGGRYLHATAGSLSASGADASASAARVVDASPGSISLTGVGATFARSSAFIAEPGEVQYSGSPAVVATTRTVEASPGSLSVSGLSATSPATRSLSADDGLIAISGSIASTVAAKSVAPEPGSTTISGIEATAAATRAIDCLPGQHIIVGYAAELDQLTNEKVLYANSGSIELSGQTAAITSTRELFAQPSAMSISGQVATVSQGKTLNADHGEMVAGGEEITATRSLSQHADSGAISITGSDAATIVARAVEAAYGAIGINGVDGALVVASASTFNAESAGYDATGAEAFGVVVRALMAGSGAYSVSGYEPLITSSRNLGAVTDTMLISKTVSRGADDVTATKSMENRTIKRVAEEI